MTSDQLQATIEALTAETQELRAVVYELGEGLRSFAGTIGTVLNAQADQAESEAARVREILQLLYDDEPGNRRRLWRVRADPAYEAAFVEAEPLVSYVVPTYTNTEGLVDVALPSILAQTYRNIEVVVVGDGAPEETAQAIAALGDPRVRYANLNRRGPYPEHDRRSMWFVAGTPPVNEAVSKARGRWIAYSADDDAVRPEHAASLVAAAQAGRHEVVYGAYLAHEADGSTGRYATFPPTYGRFGWQAAIVHAGLTSFLQHELADALFGVPNDWSLCRRMLRIGVRMAMIEETVIDYHPSGRGSGLQH